MTAVAHLLDHGVDSAVQLVTGSQTQAHADVDCLAKLLQQKLQAPAQPLAKLRQMCFAMNIQTQVMAGASVKQRQPAGQS